MDGDTWKVERDLGYPENVTADTFFVGPHGDLIFGVGSLETGNFLPTKAFAAGRWTEVHPQ
jgi:hypothetical protein